jgi:lysine 6-dehydrogenase
MDKPEILILGAGTMGRAAAHFFRHHPEGPFPVMITDRDEETLDNAAEFLRSGGRNHLDTARLDVNRSDSLLRALMGTRLCISCVPYFLNPAIAQQCLKLGVSYVDLGGNTVATGKILAMDEEARARGITMIPDTGFSPGLTNIVAWELAHRFKKCDEVRLLAGGLPQVPTGPLGYTQFFSIHGLVNEYFENAREIRDGKAVTVPSLSDCEQVEIQGQGKFEAFITSGGSSTLPDTLAGKVKLLSYKTLRYPGHMEALEYLRDLGLADETKYPFTVGEISPRQMLVKVLEAKLPKQVPDVVMLRAVAKGDGRSETIELVVKHDSNSGLSAMEQVTGFPAAAVALAVLRGRVAAGAYAPETVIPFTWLKEQMGYFGITL